MSPHDVIQVVRCGQEFTEARAAGKHQTPICLIAGGAGDNVGHSAKGVSARLLPYEVATLPLVVHKHLVEDTLRLAKHPVTPQTVPLRWLFLTHTFQLQKLRLREMKRPVQQMAFST